MATNEEPTPIWRLVVTTVLRFERELALPNPIPIDSGVVDHLKEMYLTDAGRQNLVGGYVSYGQAVRCVLVIGVPRSGTSAVAGVLHHLGVHMGDRLNPGNEYNPRGYFESLDFTDFHSRFTGIFTDHWFNLDQTYEMSERDLSDYRALIRSYELYSLWGLKDNRLLYFIDHFMRLVKSIVLVINVERPLEAVARSIQGYNWPEPISYDMALEIAHNWQRIKEDKLGALDVPKLTVNYDQLVDEPEAVVGKIAEFVGLPVNQETVGFIDRSLRHHGG